MDNSKIGTVPLTVTEYPSIGIPLVSLSADSPENIELIVPRIASRVRELQVEMLAHSAYTQRTVALVSESIEYTASKTQEIVRNGVRQAVDELEADAVRRAEEPAEKMSAIFKQNELLMKYVEESFAFVTSQGHSSEKVLRDEISASAAATMNLIAESKETIGLRISSSLDIMRSEVNRLHREQMTYMVDKEKEYKEYVKSQLVDIYAEIVRASDAIERIEAERKLTYRDRIRRWLLKLRG